MLVNTKQSEVSVWTVRVCLKDLELTFDQSVILIEQQRALTALWELQLKPNVHYYINN